mgnify:FL=1
MCDNNLRKVQLTELKILEKIDGICKKYDINYFLVGGTLLGAVRHKGFIPWDDDIDIGMLREDYEKFINVCLKDGVLGKDYYLHCNESDNDYFIPFIKVKKNNTTFAERNIENINTHKGIFLDIFPYDNVPKPHSFCEKLQAIIVRSTSDAIYLKYKIYKLKTMRRRIFVAFFALFSTKQLKKINKYFSCIYNKKNTDYIISSAGSSGYEDEILLREKVFPLKKIEFENKMFYAMNDNDYYLSKLYGNYMELPPKEERKTHMPTYISFTEGECRIHEN